MNRTIAIAAVLALVAGTLWWANRPPGGPAEGEPFLEVSVPELTGAAKEGEALFAQSCAVCHGQNAAGRGGYGPPLVDRIYRSRIHADIAFLLAVQNGVRAHHWQYGSMPPQEGIDEAAVTRITAYVRALQKENGID